MRGRIRIAVPAIHPPSLLYGPCKYCLSTGDQFAVYRNVFLPGIFLLPMLVNRGADIRTSQWRSLMASNKSAVAKYLMPLAGGLPSGLSNLAATSAGMSCGWQFSTQAACSAVRRAGNWPSSIRNLCWSSRILTFPARLECRRFSTIPSRHRNSTRSLCRRSAGGRSAPAPPAPRPRNPFQFDTRHNSFGVLSPGLHRIVGVLFFSNPREQAPVNEPHQATMPEPCEAVSS